MDNKERKPKRARSPGKIDWRNSQAKVVIMNDLKSGFLSLDESVVSPMDAWNFYKNMPEFHEVSYEQFAARLKDHRELLKAKNRRLEWEMAALAHDRHLHPRKQVDHKGNPVFDLSVAKGLLQEDVSEGKHKHMTPSALRLSQPDEYTKFAPRQFKERIYQAVKREKFMRCSHSCFRRFRNSGCFHD